MGTPQTEERLYICDGKEENIDKQNIIGQRFGLLTAIKFCEPRIAGNRKRKFVLCECECGNIIERDYDKLTRLYKGKRPFQQCGSCIDKVASTKVINLVGQKFNKLTVISEYKPANERWRVICKCDCGNDYDGDKSDVKIGHTKSCGCHNLEVASKKSTRDWTGFVSSYGIRAIKPTSQAKNKQWKWLFECFCGQEFITFPSFVERGSTTSCGCSKSPSGERLIARILDENSIEYKRQYVFDDCRHILPLKFDFALFKEGEVFCLIEHDGEQHDRPIEFYGGVEGFIETKKRDAIKNEYCRDNNITLYRIKDNIKVKEKIKQITNIIYPYRLQDMCGNMHVEDMPLLTG